MSQVCTDSDLIGQAHTDTGSPFMIGTFAPVISLFNASAEHLKFHFPFVITPFPQYVERALSIEVCPYDRSEVGTSSRAYIRFKLCLHQRCEKYLELRAS